MINKVVKIQISPASSEWEKFKTTMYTLQKETRMIMNKTIQYCWEYNNFSSDYKSKYNVYPNEKEVLNGYSLGGYLYDKLKDTSILYSANMSQSQQRAIKKWKSDSKEVFTGERSIANFKRDIPLDLHNKSIQIMKNEIDGKYYADIKLLNRSGANQLETDSSSMLFSLFVKDNSTKTIINRIINGEYKIGGSQIIKHKDKSKWFLNLTYSFEPQYKQLDKENIMGIDMGIVYPVYIAFNNSLNRDKIEGGEIEHFRKKTESRRTSMLKQGKYCGDGRIGHGRKTRIKPIEVMTDKVSNFRKTCNHKYSRFVIEQAIKNNCGTIQMEDLSGINKDKVFLKNWSYFDLQTQIKNKAKEHGIEVFMIDPKCTSQRCSKCGFIHKDNRPVGEKKQSYFKCLECGFETNADYNAARNIAIKDIDKIIKEKLKKQEKDMKNAMKYIV